MPKTESIQLAHIRLYGVVQGVGFRPFIYKLALEYNLKGWVHNTSEGVEIEVEGEFKSIKQFIRNLHPKAPPLARIERIKIDYRTPAGYEKFEIRNSIAGEEGQYQLISPDIATCDACLKEILDPHNRRYRYPFTNCTNCGPRFTIIESLPYDRPRTTMRNFPMCSLCQAEYNDPLDRRFHAQPNACPTCGPQLKLVKNNGDLFITQDVITTAAQLLREGNIIAIKGLGGFLLACDATQEIVVNNLRERKKRPSKPFAIMVTNTQEAEKYCCISLEEKELLASPSCPIVIMRRKPNSILAQSLAPNLKYLGLMLPYTPLHHILLRDAQLPLVMTSGNLSEEPIAKSNVEALRRLSGIADYFLIHNRDICSLYDDSVTMIEDKKIQLIRRARGYAPFPIHLTFKSRQILACGAEMKNTVCLAKDNYAFLSQHIGDMENIETMEHFDNTISLYKRLFDITPEIIAHDYHPDYLSTRYARELGEKGAKTVAIQHHHAHIASCMADNKLSCPVIGVIFDGTGLGDDGQIWGGEFLIADYSSYDRIGHLEYLPLPGGDTAIKKPYRIAVAYILSLLGEDALTRYLSSKEGQQINPNEIEIIKHQIARKLNTPNSSSMGRLFDTIAALTGIRKEIDYEGQAAIELEMAAYDHHRDKSAAHSKSQFDKKYPYHLTEENGVEIIKLATLLDAIMDDLLQGIPQTEIASKFHTTIAHMTNDICLLIARKNNLNRVALSGGVFQNRLLLRKTAKLLQSNGLRVFTHKQVPCNDGGISLGQAIIANFNNK
jgi:hydrogenase maturation protein HypF